MRNKTLHGTRVSIVGGILFDKADGSMYPMALRNAWMLVAAGGPRIDLHQIKVGNAARAHSVLPTRIGLGNGNRGHKISQPDGGMPRLYAVDRDCFGLQIDNTLKTAVPLPFPGIVIADKA